MEGDSEYVTDAINKDYLVRDKLLYNSVQIMFDLMGESRPMEASWIPRE